MRARAPRDGGSGEKAGKPRASSSFAHALSLSKTGARFLEDSCVSTSSPPLVLDVILRSSLSLHLSSARVGSGRALQGPCFARRP
eukprot:1188133-Prorocentrum_minimum.AAC.6